MRDAFGREIDDLGWARATRTSCDACGSRAIEIGPWGSMIQGMSPEETASLREGAAYVGVRYFTDASPIIWKCSSCGNLGIFGEWSADF